MKHDDFTPDRRAIVKAAVFDRFRSPIRVQDVPDPIPHPDAAIISVAACGVCRSDWHGWMGHDEEIRLPHVPGHELSGVITALGPQVMRWRVGDRVTVPFCCGCGRCRQCMTGNQHICDRQSQPGFTHWGAFAEKVEIRFADVNLVRLPDEIGFITAASLGCRFATSFRAIVHQGKLAAGDWLAVHGCGGVGLSAVMIGRAVGANVIAIDVRPDTLAVAKRLGANEIIDPSLHDVVARVRKISDGGAQVSVDAFGSRVTCWNSVSCLAKRGRHVQIGLTLGSEADPPIPMSSVIANELELLGSHGMQAAEYEPMLRMITNGILRPDELIGDVVDLESGAHLLERMGETSPAGVTVIRMADDVAT